MATVADESARNFMEHDAPPSPTAANQSGPLIAAAAATEAGSMATLFPELQAPQGPIIYHLRKLYSEILPVPTMAGTLKDFDMNDEENKGKVPVFTYTDSLAIAEDAMIKCFQFCLENEVTFPQLPPSFPVMIQRIQANIQNLGGSWNMQIPNHEGIIPGQSRPQSTGDPMAGGMVDRRVSPLQYQVNVDDVPEVRIGGIGPTIPSILPLAATSDLQVRIPPQKEQRNLTSTLINQQGVGFVDPPADREKVQKSFSRPPPLDEAWVTGVKQYPGVIKVDVDILFDHLKLIGAYTPGKVFPAQFLNFIKINSLKEALSSFVSYEADFPGQPESLLRSKVSELFSRLITEDSRDPELLAREGFLKGSFTQGSTTVFRYIETFKSEARKLPDMQLPATQKWLCSSFKEGLRPDLKAACIVDLKGQEWTMLQSLMDMAIVEEARLNLQHKANPSTYPSYTNAVKRSGTLSFADAGPPAKKPKTSQDYLPFDNWLKQSEKFYLPMSDQLREQMKPFNACRKCRDVQHLPGDSVPCPYLHLPAPKNGDFSPKYPNTGNTGRRQMAPKPRWSGGYSPNYSPSNSGGRPAYSHRGRSQKDFILLLLLAVEAMEGSREIEALSRVHMAPIEG